MSPHGTSKSMPPFSSVTHLTEGTQNHYTTVKMVLNLAVSHFSDVFPDGNLPESPWATNGRRSRRIRGKKQHRNRTIAGHGKRLAGCKNVTSEIIQMYLNGIHLLKLGRGIQGVTDNAPFRCIAGRCGKFPKLLG